MSAEFSGWLCFKSQLLAMFSPCSWLSKVLSAEAWVWAWPASTTFHVDVPIQSDVLNRAGYRSSWMYTSAQIYPYIWMFSQTHIYSDCILYLTGCAHPQRGIGRFCGDALCASLDCPPHMETPWLSRGVMNDGAREKEKWP